MREIIVKESFKVGTNTFGAGLYIINGDKVTLKQTNSTFNFSGETALKIIQALNNL